MVILTEKRASCRLREPEFWETEKNEGINWTKTWKGRMIASVLLRIYKYTTYLWAKSNSQFTHSSTGLQVKLEIQTMIWERDLWPFTVTTSMLIRSQLPICQDILTNKILFCSVLFCSALYVYIYPCNLNLEHFTTVLLLVLTKYTYVQSFIKIF